MKTDTRVDNEKYGLAPGSKVWCATHPVLRHKLTKLRDERTDSRIFRHLLREVTFYLGYVHCNVLWTVYKVRVCTRQERMIRLVVVSSCRYDATDDLETTPKQIKVCPS